MTLLTLALSLPVHFVAAAPPADVKADTHVTYPKHDLMTQIMAFAADAAAIVCLLGGLFFLVVGVIGLVRLPDIYHRMHAVSKCSTLGLVGLLLAAIFHIGTVAVLTKALLTVVFAFVATPVGTHMLAKAALAARAPQWSGTLSDDHEIDGMDEA